MQAGWLQSGRFSSYLPSNILHQNSIVFSDKKFESKRMFTRKNQPKQFFIKSRLQETKNNLNFSHSSDIPNRLNRWKVSNKNYRVWSRWKFWKIILATVRDHNFYLEMSDRINMNLNPLVEPHKSQAALFVCLPANISFENYLFIR